jgi:hypothetical protein
VSVQVTTQGSEKAIETLNAALQKMGDLLSSVNLKLTANESNLLNLAIFALPAHGVMPLRSRGLVNQDADFDQ